MSTKEDDVEYQSDDENTPLLPSLAPAERYFPRRFYTGQQLTSISEEKDDPAGFHASLPPSPSTPERRVSVSEAFDRYVRHRRSSRQQDSLWERVRYRLRPQTFALLHIAFATVCMTGMLILLPLYTGGLLMAGSDPYVGAVLAGVWLPIISFLTLAINKLFLHRSIRLRPPLGWKRLLLISGLWGLSYLLVMYCSPPTRLPVHLQPILASLALPISAIARYFIIKREISRMQILSVTLHVLGICIAAWPIIFNIDGKAADYHWLYFLLFTLGLVPGVVGFVYTTKCLSQRRAHTFCVLPWSQLLVFLSLFLAFWSNFIPGLGTVSDFAEFADHIDTGFTCFYGLNAHNCTAIPARSAVFLLSYSGGFSALMMILRFREGLNYLAVILGFSSLFATVFWSLFLDVNMNVNFAPRLDANDSVYLLCGLGVVVLAVVSFVYLGFTREERQPTVFSPRLRASSFPRPSNLRFAKPEPPSKNKPIKKTKSAPSFNIYL